MSSDNSEGLDWERYESELDSMKDADRQRVDSVETQRAPVFDMGALPMAEHRPIIPGWMRSASQFNAALVWTARYAGHTAAFHCVRVPLYAARVAGRAPAGIWRVACGFVRWLADWEGEPVRQAAATRADAETYLRLARVRDSRVRARGWAAVVLAVVAIAALLLFSFRLSLWSQSLVLVVVIGILGWIGAPEDRPLLDRAVIVSRAQMLTSTVVVRALSVLGLGGVTQALSKNEHAIRFPNPITRDGPGWRADIDLPYGVTAGEVIERRDKLASGLGRPLGCVWPEGDHDISPGRLRIWVGDVDMASAKKPAWPLLKTGTVDLFTAFPFGTDPRGRAVTIELMYTNVLVGSIPGAGKTFSLRVPLLGAALDPRVEMWVYELKGTGDLEPLEKICQRYASGADDDSVEDALHALRDLRKECARRASTIKGLSKDKCPENKVTPQLANKKHLKLHPLVVAIDECQELFTHPDFGKEAGELAEKVIKLGRALGICLMLATQRPDAKSLPTGVSANVGTRFCLRVMGQTENDMILGTSSYKNGIRATMFTKRDKGLGYLVGASDDAQIVSTYYVDGPAAENICRRAYAARQEAGTLPNPAQTPPPERAKDTLLQDLLAVWPAGQARTWNEKLVAALVELRPDVYQRWAKADKPSEQLTMALKRHDISTRQVWGTDTNGNGANRRGIARDDLAAAAGQHLPKPGNRADNESSSDPL